MNSNDEFLYSIAQIAISGIRDRMAAQFPDDPKLAGQTAACIMAMLAAELFRCVTPQDGAARAINTYLDMARADTVARPTVSCCRGPGSA